MLRTPSVPVPGGAARRRVTAVVVGLMVAGLGGASLLMLGMLSLAGLTEIHSMNGIKTLLSGTQNLVALGVFIVRGIIFWPQALLMMGGAIAGGYGGAYFARKIDPGTIRWIVIAVGLAMTVYLFRR